MAAARYSDNKAGLPALPGRNHRQPQASSAFASLCPGSLVQTGTRVAARVSTSTHIDCHAATTQNGATRLLGAFVRGSNRIQKLAVPEFVVDRQNDAVFVHENGPRKARNLKKISH